MTLNTARIGTWLAALAVSFLLICHCSDVAGAQTPPKRSLPGVGTIKDYPATGLMTGCGNLYFHKRGQKPTDASFVFLARGDGSNAWMNLNGRDVRLKQIKTNPRRNRKGHQLFYRLGQIRITVTFETSQSDGTSGESDDMFKMTITVRQGGRAKTVRALGSSDC